MAERRRRRKIQSGEDSEELTDDSDEEQVPGQRKTLVGSDGGDSEYESADDEELGEEEEEEDDELLIMPDGVGIGDENKQLDDDEDRKNPQYIPKKGTFYEHDDRTVAEEDVEKPGNDCRPEEPTVKKEVIKKKVWKEDNKWNHDKFNEFDQAPKTREELIAVYGYDIRNEEGPPRARRRRRYGRGPNKYTRNWEDLDAYAKPVRGGTVRGGGLGRGGNRSLTGSKKTLCNNEEFPALNSPQQRHYSNEHDDYRSEHHSPKNDTHRGHPDEHLIIDSDKIQQQQQMQFQHQHNLHNRNSISSPQMQELKGESYGGRGRGGKGRGRGAGRGLNRDQHRYNDERSLNNHDMHSGGRGNRGGYQQKGPLPHQTHVDDITLDMKNVNINTQNRDDRHKKNRGGGNSDNRRNTVPPRLQESAAAAANLHGRGRGGNSSPGGDGSASSRPKRYSSQRQRSIPDQPVPPFQQQQGYIDPALEAGYQGGVYEGGVNPATSHTVSAPPSQLPIAGGAPHSFVPPAFTSPPTFPPEPFLGRPPAPRMFPPVTQSPHIFTGPPLGAPPPVGAPPVPPGPPVTGPPFIPHEINYAAHPGPQPGPHGGPLPGAAPLAGPHPPQFPPFQGFTPGPVAQPGEIYSNGVTYYNTESQQQLPRNIVPLQKRPKAAIPIVPPPERRHGGSSSRGEGSQDDQQYADSANVLESVGQDYSEEVPAEYESNLIDDQEVVVEEQIDRESEDQTAGKEEEQQQVESVADTQVEEEPAPKSLEKASDNDAPDTIAQSNESEQSESQQKPEINSIDNDENNDPEKLKTSEGQPVPVEETKSSDGSVEKS